MTVDGVEITTDEVASLHRDIDAIDPDSLVGSVLLVVLQEAFAARAFGLGVVPSTEAIDAAYAARIEPVAARGDVAEVLGARNETEARIRIEAELDVLRDEVGAHLVRTESPGFDLDRAVTEYHLEQAEVCVRQIQLPDAADYERAAARLAAGEAFADVARDVSIDPFVSREEGVGAGGDLGCSAPNALPPGLDRATLDAPVGEATGPVASTVGLHLLVVYDRTVADVDEIRGEVLDHAVPRQGPVLFRSWAIDVLQTIEVVVDPAFGTWGVIPETEPSPTVVPPYRTGDIIDP